MKGPEPELHALMEREWQYQLEHNPTYASVLGERRWNDRWDDLSLSAIEADHQHNGSCPRAGSCMASSPASSRRRT